MGKGGIKEYTFSGFTVGVIEGLVHWEGEGIHSPKGTSMGRAGVGFKDLGPNVGEIDTEPIGPVRLARGGGLLAIYK